MSTSPNILPPLVPAPGHTAVQGIGQNLSHTDARQVIENRVHPTQPTYHPRKALQSFAPLSLLPPPDPTFADIAAGLGNDVDAIFNYVRNNFRYLPMYGVQKGAYGALIDKQGNSFDLSALLVALLRAAGYTAHFMFGELQLTGAQAGAWLGTDPNNPWSASNMLANGGVAASMYMDPNTFQWFVHVSHVWVKVDVTGLGNWYVFDPSYKVSTSTGVVDLATITGFDATTFVNSCSTGATITADYVQNLNMTNLRSQLSTAAANLISWINTNKPDATIDDIIGKRVITADTTQQRNTSLSYQSSVVPTEWTDIPQAYKTTYRFQFDTIDQTFNSEDICGKRLTLFWNASHQAVLALDGTVLATSTAQGVGTYHTGYHTITHPVAGAFANSGPFGQTVITDTPYLIAQAWGNSSPEMAFQHQKRQNANRAAGGLDTDESVLGESLAVLYHNLDAQSVHAADMIGKIMGNMQTVWFHQVGLCSHGAGPATDLGGIMWSTSALDNNYTNRAFTDKVIAMRSIGFESVTIAQVPAVSGVSADTVLSTAHAAGQQIYFATSANWATNVRPNLINYDAATLNFIEVNYINAGWQVMCHQNGLTVQNHYNGFGFYGIWPNGGIVGIITGFLNGGGSDAPQTVAENNRNAAYQQAKPDNLDRVEVGSRYHEGLEFVADKFTGNHIYRHTDFTSGPREFPYGLPFTRTFNTKETFPPGVGVNGQLLASGGQVLTALGRGWRHNYMISIEESNNGLLNGGLATGVGAASNIVQAFAATLLVKQNQNGTNYVLSMLTANEIGKLITNNTATVRDGEHTYSFTKLADGSYISPKGVNFALAKNGLTYVMKSFDNVIYTFALNNNPGAFVAVFNRIGTIQYPNGVTVSFDYGTFPFNLLRVYNNFGHSLYFTYSALNLLTRVGDSISGGQKSDITIDTVTGNMTNINDSANQNWAYTYDTQFRMTSFTAPSNSTVVDTVTYNARNQVTQLTNPVYTTTFFYVDNTYCQANSPAGTLSTTFNADGQPTIISDGFGTTTFSYDGMGRVVAKGLPDGDAITYQYDMWNRVTAQSHSGSGVTINESFSYAGLGTASFDKWTSHTDGNNNTWTRVFDGNTGLLQSETGPTVNGQTPTKSYGYTNGLLSSVTDETGIVTTYGYTSELVTSMVHDAGVGRLNLTTTYGYDGYGNKNFEQFPAGNSKSYTWDIKRRMLTMTDADGQTTYTYDIAGNQLTASRAGLTTTTTYTVFNTPVTVTDPLNAVTTFTYDGAGRVSSALDAVGRLRSYTYTLQGRLATITDSGILEESRTYKPGGSIATITDGNGNTTTFNYDGVMRRSSNVYPGSGGSEIYGYDGNSNITSFTTRGGNTIGQSFDALNRVVTRTPQGQPVVTNTYDLAGRLLTTSTPVVAGDPSSGQYSKSYDTAGRLASETNPQSQVVSYQYDANSNLSKLTYPSGYYVERTYDALDRLSAIKLNGNTLSSVGFTYDTLSRRLSKNFDNGVGTGYGYDNGSNRISMTLAFNGSTASWNNAFNLVHQMTRQASSDGAFIWRPSAAGSIAYGAVNNLNQYPTVGAQSLTYDTTGRLATYNGWTYGYNTESMLTSATNGVTNASFVYDPYQRQTQKTVGATKTKYVYSGSHMLEEYDGTAGTLTTRYVYGGADEVVLQMNAAGALTYLHDDHLGSIIAQSNPSGVVGNKYNYSPYGEATLTGTTFGYTAQRWDSEIGLYHYKARYYHPGIGRFLQPDPVGYGAGMNLYAYVKSDPLNHTDPDGLESIDTVSASDSLFGPGVANVVNGVVSLSKRRPSQLEELSKPASIQTNAGKALSIIPIGAVLAEAGTAVASAIKLTTLRARAVRTAWKQEKALLEAGKPGTRSWTKEQVDEIRTTGKAKDFEGHHTMDVKRNPLHSPNENYIKFVQKGKEHLENHGGHYGNPANGPEFFDRAAMLKQ